MTAMTELPPAPDYLPPGWAATVHPADRPESRPHPAPAAEPARSGPPPMSGVITTVPSRTGTPVTIHRADYDVLTPRGGWTVHGYAWRCPCRRLAIGYGPVGGFAEALADARDHQCGGPS